MCLGGHAWAESRGTSSTPLSERGGVAGSPRLGYVQASASANPGCTRLETRDPGQRAEFRSKNRLENINVHFRRCAKDDSNPDQGGFICLASRKLLG